MAVLTCRENMTCEIWRESLHWTPSSTVLFILFLLTVCRESLLAQYSHLSNGTILVVKNYED